MLDLADFEPRGTLGHYYRRGLRSSATAAYALHQCDGCGRPCLVLARLAPDQDRFCTVSCALTGERGGGWKGDATGYRSAHDRVRRVRGKAASCVWGCQASRYDWASMTGHLLDPYDYVAMCHRCHLRFDAAVRVTETRPAKWIWLPWRTERLRLEQEAQRERH